MQTVAERDKSLAMRSFDYNCMRSSHDGRLTRHATQVLRHPRASEAHQVWPGVIDDPVRVVQSLHADDLGATRAAVRPYASPRSPTVSQAVSQGKILRGFTQRHDQ